MQFTRYTYPAGFPTTFGIPDEFPVDWHPEPDVAALGVADAATIARQAGFDPDDSATHIGRLTRGWEGHPAGALVVSGAELEGRPFAVGTDPARWIE